MGLSRQRAAHHQAPRKSLIIQTLFGPDSYPERRAERDTESASGRHFCQSDGAPADRPKHGLGVDFEKLVPLRQGIRLGGALSFRGSDRYAPLHSHTFTMDEVNEAFRMASDRGQPMKVHLAF